MNETLSTFEVCELAGITPRQLRYWAERRFLDPPRGGGGHGTAFVMRWSIESAERAEILGAVSRLLGHSAIEPMARALRAGETLAVLTDEDYELTVELRPLFAAQANLAS